MISTRVCGVLARDRFGFVLTPEMSRAMGGDKEAPPKQYMDMCERALLALRQ
jgi:hypothetical protein